MSVLAVFLARNFPTHVPTHKAARHRNPGLGTTPHNQPLTWAAKHLFTALGDLRQEVDDQAKGSGREARTDRRPLDGVILIVKQTLNGWGNRLRTWPARE